ncbi:MAG: PIN domain-containing protein [Bacteroidales bacterium]|nr:PIN domain-containing protein [Bacteroidales bacterium]
MKHKRYLLDTNICAYILRGKYNLNEQIKAIGGMEYCYISEVTIAELLYGKEYGKLKGGPKYKDQQLEKFFNDINTLPIYPVFALYGKEKARLRRAGTPISEFDLLIGCTSVQENMIMVTQNVKDFKNITGIHIENWIPS